MRKFYRTKKTRKIHRKVPKKVPQKKMNRKFLKKQRRQQIQSSIEKKRKKIAASLFTRKKFGKIKCSDTMNSHSKICSSKHKNLLLRFVFMFLFIFQTVFAGEHSDNGTLDDFFLKQFKLPDCGVLETRLIHEEQNVDIKNFYKESEIVKAFCEKEEMTVFGITSETQSILSKHCLNEGGRIMAGLAYYIYYQDRPRIIKKILKDYPDAIKILEKTEEYMLDGPSRQIYWFLDYVEGRRILNHC